MPFNHQVISYIQENETVTEELDNLKLDTLATGNPEVKQTGNHVTCIFS